MRKLSQASISQKISRIFLIGAALLLLCYGVLFALAIHITENKNSMVRLELIAPHYFGAYKNGELGKIKINPLLTSYDQFQQLPIKIQQNISPEWAGVETIQFDDDESEFAIVAERIADKTYYLVEDVGSVEWSDDAFFLIELLLLAFGIVLFLLAALAIKNTAKSIAKPFHTLAQQLSIDSGESFEEIIIQGAPTLELQQTLDAINSYREKIAFSIAREQSFTRYVSHELRTPMMVIKGCLSILKKQDQQATGKQCQRINDAVNEMQTLTQTLLLMARDEVMAPQPLIISKALIESQLDAVSNYLENNHCTIRLQVLDEVRLFVEPVLFNVLLKNLLINAINCSPNGHISLVIDHQQLSIEDNGSGLNHTDRGYEGFGVGLVLVNDICKKYHWSFSLENNADKGCTATISFNQTTD